MIGQIKTYVPDSKYSKVIIEENFEPMVEVLGNDKLIIDEKDYYEYRWVRKTVYERLLEASSRLPKGIVMKLIEGYRPIWLQQKYWNSACDFYEKKYTSWTRDEVEVKANEYVARPTRLANHHCGGAIDVELFRESGEPIDMGPNHISVGGFDCSEKLPMFSEFISEEQADNRSILREVMECCEFVWYTHEWWHYCLHDRMWAVHLGKDKCFYGSVELMCIKENVYTKIIKGARRYEQDINSRPGRRRGSRFL